MAEPLKKRRDESDLEYRSRIIRYKQNQRDKDAPLVTPEAANHGNYERDFVTDVDNGTKAWTLINRGGTPVARWKAAHALSDSQVTAIEHCERLWRDAWTPMRITAQYGERNRTTGDADAMMVRQTDAREDLKRIEAHFPGKTRDYWCLFENVCRFGMPAGVAGGELGFSSRTASERAHTVVCFVADIITSKERL